MVNMMNEVHEDLEKKMHYFIKPSVKCLIVLGNLNFLDNGLILYLV